ncbi:energy-coupling factor transporter transmembrane protein EcfT [Rhizobiaceae bacterium BDR2-2]|uniref:Energy-coupling factor transporter transmembrane protein EcfT n=1 Tax=Ectorhizobium quercum TaxID=2965071 RepID=A0AAE3STV5_9HYPH|nr:energy-coupling factor transporter transmembrane protein EcfT [Ectorhizobium quercum]MCX8996367.1 energy-coupling factor transporter transmembrane protein EcfT [Ectorhizobium quercum]MCX8998594.1 energy-coupling factor transporter transmembrane protein EcfT [Ectorhizobium quercum]
MKSLYVEGTSPLHRLPVRPKLVFLALLGISLFLTRNPLLLLIGPALGALVYFTLGLPAAEALRRLRPVFLTIAIVAAFSFMVNSAEEALLQLLRLTTLMLFAAAVTATTTVGDFIDEITRLAQPLERAGLVRAADIGLAFGLVVRFVPEILARYEAIREAHKARGLKVRPLTLVAPLVILTLREADQIAAAIDARGLRRH